jgi:hypothetical protein
VACRNLLAAGPRPGYRRRVPPWDFPETGRLRDGLRRDVSLPLPHRDPVSRRRRPRSRTTPGARRPRVRGRRAGCPRTAGVLAPLLRGPDVAGVGGGRLPPMPPGFGDELFARRWHKSGLTRWKRVRSAARHRGVNRRVTRERLSRKMRRPARRVTPAGPGGFAAPRRFNTARWGSIALGSEGRLKRSGRLGPEPAEQGLGLRVVAPEAPPEFSRRQSEVCSLFNHGPRRGVVQVAAECLLPRRRLVVVRRVVAGVSGPLVAQNLAARLGELPADARIAHADGPVRGVQAPDVMTTGEAA